MNSDPLAAAGTPLPRTPGVAVWEAVRADLLSRIKRGDHAPDEQLPSETALAQNYGVNRLTVRRALNELARVGVLRTMHGVGSFVAPQLMRHRIDDGRISLLESMSGRGHNVTQHILETVEHPGPRRAAGVPELAQVAGFGLSDPSELWTFPDFPGPLIEHRYVLDLDETPWCTSFAVVPKALVPADWDGTESIFSALAKTHGLAVRRDDRRFSAILADTRDAALLHVPAGAALLLLSGTNVDQDGRIVAYIVHHIRGDRAEYALRVPGPSIGPGEEA
ncbi:GntR family transcriptional regulator [Actinoallomurus bryophytorum]|uniref:GntR family transcriptional regulator n=1 Tax=Actinoallomurus bryophytorum TaxID=1490222 RepID=A0A543C1K3_9ACTN|nr:GntR family transcriptional regulator [Actinoallomurus bryophytorum]TQL90948.1 GntR family transcriptional regulator [Actinoallomurus bryophytorum]